ncbi:decaprenyl-phosphate phosphoribosyltransferase [Candidatus Daviesbacteria bacterium]|nr:decaprenyl-phosphate phosphoribosyltransferase [Candidatus Daviesbacteria bacterium]MBI4035351.1 decaprenyl-phosphate phosphoribosyltransferase [Candidatus Daviesbacteria bacterium]
MVKLFWGLIKASRPRQWIKNFALFAALIFSGTLFDPISQLKTLQAFALFCAFSSATYLLNDVFDIERDKLHPFKKRRAITSGIIPVWLAVTISLLIVAIGLPISYQLSPSFFFAALAYLVLQLFYSAYLKQIILIDVLVIAAGFVLRVYAGVWAIDAHLNVWFLLSVTSFALFLAIGKRRSERTLMEAQAGRHRETLLHYPPNLLDSLTTMFANSTWLTYAFFAFLQPPISAPHAFITFLGVFELPQGEAKYLMVTVPVVIYAVMRYLYIIYEKKEGESPERVILTDMPLLITVIIWLGLVLGIIYYL